MGILNQIKDNANEVFANVQMYERQMRYSREVTKQKQLEAEKVRAEVEKKKAEVTKWEQDMLWHQLKWTNQLNAYMEFLRASKLVRRTANEPAPVFGDYNVAMRRYGLAEGQTWFEPYIWFEDTFLRNGRYYLKIAFDGKRRDDTADVFRNIVTAHFRTKEIGFGVASVRIMYETNISRNVVIIELIQRELAREFERISEARTV
ncbi:TPA: hypothetical protein TZ704_002106 [Streptococcus suis]|nr:hypothetical protein [Streptococcus suis]